VNRTYLLGNPTLRSVDDLVSIVDSITMQNTQINPRANTINNSESLQQLLSDRLLLWDQQDAAQAAGEWHQALDLEQSIRSISSRIRGSMGLIALTQEGGSEL
jgi:hypothetical protein